MGSSLRSRFHLLIGLTGTLVFFAGVFMLASGIVIRDLLNRLENFSGWGKNTCQYWAGIPTILTGGILVLSASLNRHQSLKYISLCFVLITMVLALGLIMEEVQEATGVRYHSREDSFMCKEEVENRARDDESVHKLKEDCLKIKEAAPWYYIMLFGAAIDLVSGSFVTLILFGDWILFVAPKTQHNNFELAQVSPAYQTGCYSTQSQQFSNPRQDPIHPNPV